MSEAPVAASEVQTETREVTLGQLSIIQPPDRCELCGREQTDGSRIFMAHQAGDKDHPPLVYCLACEGSISAVVGELRTQIAELKGRVALLEAK